VRRVIDVVRQVLGINGLVTATLQAVVLEPIDQDRHARLTRLQLLEQLMLILATW